MILRDLLEKGEGKMYMVNSSNPTTVIEIDCIILSMQDFIQRFLMYRNWVGYVERNYDYIICRKSKAKNNVLRDGTPRLVSINSNALCVYPTERDLDETKYTFYKTCLFLSKEDACNYVIEKLKRKKMDLNGMINKVNKYKFGVTE